MMNKFVRPKDQDGYESESGNDNRSFQDRNGVLQLLRYEFVFNQPHRNGTPLESDELDEMKSTKRLSEAGAFPVHGNDFSPGVALLLLEYANGGSLASYMKYLSREQLRA